MGEMTKVAQKFLSALQTVQAFSANAQEQTKFGDRINLVLDLARKEAIASGIFFGRTGWSGNMISACWDTVRSSLCRPRLG